MAGTSKWRLVWCLVGAAISVLSGAGVALGSDSPRVAMHVGSEAQVGSPLTTNWTTHAEDNYCVGLIGDGFFYSFDRLTPGFEGRRASVTFSNRVRPKVRVRTYGEVSEGIPAGPSRAPRVRMIRREDGGWSARFRVGLSPDTYVVLDGDWSTTKPCGSPREGTWSFYVRRR